MKTNILSIVVLTLITLLVFSCKDEEVPTEIIDSRLQRVIGKYQAIKFILTDELDNPRDILKIGGSVTAEITKSAAVNGRLIIPMEFYKGYPGTDISYTGTVEIVGNDTIRFNGTRGALSSLGYRVEGDSLKAEISTVGYYLMILKKTKE